MSGKVSGYVFDLQGLEPSEKFVLVAYADHSDHDGRNIFPAVKTISKKTGYSARHVQRITRKLEEMNLLIPNAGKKKRTNKWRINMEWKQTDSQVVNEKTTQESSKPTPRSLKTTPVSPEPSINHQLILNPPPPPLSASKTPKPKSQFVIDMERLESAFADARGCSLPDWESDPKVCMKLWRSPLKRILKSCKDDIVFAERVVTDVTRRMRNDGLTFAYPTQIEKTAASHIIDVFNPTQVTRAAEVY